MGEIHQNIIVVDYNPTFKSMDKSSREKFKKETVALNDTSDQMDLIGTYRTSTQNQKNTHSFQLHIECSSG